MATTRPHDPWTLRLASANGNAAVEYVAAAALLATIVAAVIAVLPNSADAPLARSVGGAVTQLVHNANITPGGASASHRARRSVIRSHGQWDSRTRPVPTSRPPHVAWRSTTRRGAFTSRRAAHRWHVGGCAICAGFDMSHEFGPSRSATTSSTRRGRHHTEHASEVGVDGTTGAADRASQRDSGRKGVDLGGHVLAWLSIVRADASHATTLTHGSAQLRITHRAHAHVGADASLEARARVTPSRQSLDLEAGAVAGAVGRVEHRTAVRVAGIGLDATLGAEGWAGAGARAGLHVVRTRSGIWSYHANMGAALGLGGALRVSGTVDMRSLLARSRAP
jgi:hypothetical protein